LETIWRLGVLDYRANVMSQAYLESVKIGSALISAFSVSLRLQGLVSMPIISHQSVDLRAHENWTAIRTPLMQKLDTLCDNNYCFVA